MNKLYKTAILNLLKASNDLDHVGLGSFSGRSLKLAQTLIKRAESPQELNTASIAGISFDDLISKIKQLLKNYKGRFLFSNGGVETIKDNIDLIVREALESIKEGKYDLNNLLSNNKDSKLKKQMDLIESGTWQGAFGGRSNEQATEGYRNQIRTNIGEVFKAAESIMTAAAAAAAAPAAPDDVRTLNTSQIPLSVSAPRETENKQTKRDQAFNLPGRRYKDIDEVVQRWLRFELKRPEIKVDGKWGEQTEGALQQLVNGGRYSREAKNTIELAKYLTDHKDGLEAVMKMKETPAATETLADVAKPEAPVAADPIVSIKLQFITALTQLSNSETNKDTQFKKYLEGIRRAGTNQRIYKENVLGALTNARTFNTSLTSASKAGGGGLYASELQSLQTLITTAPYILNYNNV